MPPVYDNFPGGLHGYLQVVTALAGNPDEDRVTANTSSSSSSSSSSGGASSGHSRDSKGRSSSTSSSLDTVRACYAPPKAEVAVAVARSGIGSSANAVTAARSVPVPAYQWRHNPSEVEAWQAVQAAVDLLVQRSAAVTEAQPAQGKVLRSWADALLALGSGYFSGQGR
jgi:hypothetical protein